MPSSTPRRAREGFLSSGMEILPWKCRTDPAATLRWARCSGGDSDLPPGCSAKVSSAAGPSPPARGYLSGFSSLSFPFKIMEVSTLVHGLVNMLIPP